MERPIQRRKICEKNKSNTNIHGCFCFFSGPVSGSYRLQAYEILSNSHNGKTAKGPGGQIVEVANGNVYIDGEKITNLKFSSDYIIDLLPPGNNPTAGMHYRRYSCSLGPLDGGIIVLSDSLRVGSVKSFIMNKGVFQTYDNVAQVEIINYYIMDYEFYSGYDDYSNGITIEGWSKFDTNDYVAQSCYHYIDLDTGKVIDSDWNIAYRGSSRKAVFSASNAYASKPLDEAMPPSGFDVDYVNEKVTGGSNLMEYSTNGTTWIDVANGEISISSIIPAATAKKDSVVKIRYKETANYLASQPTDVAIKPRPAAPVKADVWFDGISESIMLKNTIEYRAGSTGDFVSLADGVTSIDTPIGEINQPYQFRVRSIDTEFASAILTVTVPKRAAAPAAVYDGSLDAIKSVSTKMEYSLNNGSTWVDCAGVTIPRSVFGDNETTVLIRVKAIATAPYSYAKEVVVPGIATTTYFTDFILDIPSGTTEEYIETNKPDALDEISEDEEIEDNIADI